MKAGIFALFVLLGCICAAYAACVPGCGGGTTNACKFTHGSSGRPTCTNAQELTKKWRNNNDPTKYWVCSASGQAATQMQCSVGTLFLDSAQDCVSLCDWVWTAPCDPPTLDTTEVPCAGSGTGSGSGVAGGCSGTGSGSGVAGGCNGAGAAGGCSGCAACGSRK